MIQLLEKHDRGWIVPEEQRVKPKTEMGAPAIVGPAPVFILHSTEVITGDSKAEMSRWWERFANPPHLVLKLSSQTGAGHLPFENLIQLYSFEEEARALWHPSVHTHGLNEREKSLIEKYTKQGKTLQTNGMGYVTQMEVVGFAKHMQDLSDDDLRTIGDVVRKWGDWVKDKFGDKDFRVSPWLENQTQGSTWGMFGVDRMTDVEWEKRLKRDGRTNWNLAQHSDVPTQRHWDANINIGRVAGFANGDIR